MGVNVVYKHPTAQLQSGPSLESDEDVVKVQIGFVRKQGWILDLLLRLRIKPLFFRIEILPAVIFPLCRRCDHHKQVHASEVMVRDLHLQMFSSSLPFIGFNESEE